MHSLEVASVSFLTVEPGCTRGTAEVVFRNGGAEPVAFTDVRFCGRPLWTAPRATRSRLASVFGLGGGGGTTPNATPEEPAWWGFTPSRTVPPGGYAAFRLSLDPAAADARDLSFDTDGGATLRVFLPPRPSAPRHPVAAFALASDGRRATLSFKGRAAPSALRANGRAVPFRLLRPADPGRPAAAVFSLPKALAAGAPLFLELTFADGSGTRAFLRALPGIAFDALDAIGPDGDRMLEGDAAARFGFDQSPAVRRLPLDPLCADRRAGARGASAADLAAAASRMREGNPGQLAGVDICVSLAAGDLALYAMAGDAILLKPYMLHWAADRRDFQGREGDAVAEAVAAAAPLPVLWVPERFEAERTLSGAELRDEAWEALLRGAHGVRVHHFANGAPPRPDVAAAIRRLGDEIAALRPVLETCVPVSHRSEGGVSVSEAWSGDGALLFVRSAFPGPARFSYAPPPWLDSGSVSDPLGGTIRVAPGPGGRLDIELDSASPGRLLWIPDRGRAERD